MREILFRGKQLSTNDWAYGYFTMSPSETAYIHECIRGGDSSKKVLPDTVSQYTGLMDIDEKKIFEGDIIRHYNRPDNKAAYSDGLVFFDEKKSSFMKRISGGSEYHVSRECAYKVIGNRWDNPELLEGLNNGKK